MPRVVGAGAGDHFPGLYQALVDLRHRGWEQSQSLDPAIVTVRPTPPPVDDGKPIKANWWTLTRRVRADVEVVLPLNGESPARRFYLVDRDDRVTRA